MINYRLIDESITHYENAGYIRIESPWTVTEQVDDITRPSDATAFKLKHNDKCLVASGEQSFLYLYLKGFIPRGMFQTVTPCFRFEAFDFLHTKYFIKNELIKTDVTSQKELTSMVDTAMAFFKNYFGTNLLVISDDDGYDIMYDGKYELGSYGIRKCEFLKWIYGTGCAEPRTSSLINLYGISQETNNKGHTGAIL